MVTDENGCVATTEVMVNFNSIVDIDVFEFSMFLTHQQAILQLVPQAFNDVTIQIVDGVGKLYSAQYSVLQETQCLLKQFAAGTTCVK